jgi:hypothetical protein
MIGMNFVCLGRIVEVRKTAEESRNGTEYSAEEAITMTQTLFDRVDKSLSYMSALQDNFIKFDRISNQEIHIISKIHKFLRKSLAVEKKNQTSGTQRRGQLPIGRVAAD